MTVTQFHTVQAITTRMMIHNCLTCFKNQFLQFIGAHARVFHCIKRFTELNAIYWMLESDSIQFMFCLCKS